MILGKNKVYHMNFLEGAYLLPAKSAKLIIADPPYFEVKGSFDFIWNSFEDYLKDVEEWVKACKYLLADNGTLFWWGDKRKIAYSQIILDRYFNLENSLVWNKIDSIQRVLGSVESNRCFTTHNERLLMYSNEIDMTGLESIKLDINNFKTLRNYFQYIQEEIGIGLKKINDKLGHRKAEHCFYWKSTQWDMPTEKTYNELIKAFRIDLLDEFKEYETLRQEYETLRRPFNNYLKLEEVLTFSQEGHITKLYDHETKKPPKLTRSLINTCSLKNDLVIIPFAGSGTECEMSIQERREFIGFDTEKKYVEMSNKRCLKHLQNRQLSLMDFIEI